MGADTVELENKITNILCDLCGGEPDEMEPDLDLFGEGLLDSFGAIQLVMELEKTFSVSLPIEDIPRERIATPKAIAALVREKIQ